MTEKDFRPPGYKAPKTRIKITEYNSGEKRYEPQYYKPLLWEEIIFSPFIIIFGGAGLFFDRWKTYSISPGVVHCLRIREEAQGVIDQRLTEHLIHAQQKHGQKIKQIKKEKYP